MTHVRPGNGAPTTTVADRHDGPHESSERHSVFLRNEDDVEHTLDLRVAAEGHLLAETSRDVAGDSQSTIDAEWAAAGTVQIELWADHGCAASISLESAAPEYAPAPEFIVRPGSIVVAGVH